VSIQAYQRTAQLGEAPRAGEYRTFAMVTRDLIQARDNGPVADFGAYMNALFRNRELWEILAVDCAGDGNGLPEAVRAQIISLALFVDRHTSAVCRDDASIEPLIDINRTIMDGLAAATAQTTR
jgi:flagellar biosynthesis activator protein FlaF